MLPVAHPGSLCWVNGEPGGAVSAFDRGLAFGDGVFESMRFNSRGIPLLEYHLQRLREGCERLGIALDCDHLRAEVDTVLGSIGANHPRGVLKLIVTRGMGGRGYAAPVDAVASRILLVSGLPQHAPAWAADGVKVRFCDMRLGNNAALAGIKHLNRLEQVMARREWSDPDIADGLLADARGRIVEGIATNFFIASGGRLVTPVIDSCGVAGVMRRHVLEVVCPALGIPVSIAACERAMLGGAQEMFLCNAVVGIWPVRRLAARALPVGALTRKVQAHVAALFAD